jgi:predicted tellurium resistance membrane protein TerC
MALKQLHDVQVFGVTTDPFILWTSNMWALLSLRSLYAFVAVAMGRLVYLDKSIALVLAWVSFKLIGEYFGLEISTPLSLGVVASTLGAGVGVSLLFPPKEEEGKE